MPNRPDKMTRVWYFWLLAVVSAFLLGCEAFDAPKTHSRDTDVRVVPNEYLFTAGNDSSGTAAITFTSQLNSGKTPTIKQFTNHSFPHSCTSHPTRCSLLTYSSYRFSDTNHTRLMFYVPLMGSDSAALGLMELWHDGETISQTTMTTQITKTRRQCDPVSVVKTPKIGIYFICAAGDGYSLMLCEVRNSNNISEATLSCMLPHSLGQPLTNFPLLSNFIVYNTPRPFIFYFMYGSVLYQMTHVGSITDIAYLQTSHCRYVHLDRVNASFLIGHCYERDKLRTFYINLDLHQYIAEDANVSRYHCPNPQQYVTVSVSRQQPRVTASYQESGMDQGRFNLNASQVIFAECFSYRNQTHFLYQDSELGVFVKPNISVDLRSRLVQVSNLSCDEDQACKQPVIFSSRYLTLMYNVNDLRHQQVSVFDLYGDLKKRTLSLLTSSTAQIAFISKFTRIIISDSSTSPPDHVPENPPSSKTTSVHVAIGVPFGVVPLILLVGICVAAIILIRSRHHKKGEVGRTRPYAPVATDKKDAIKLNEIKRPQDDNDHQATHLLSNKENSLSPTPPPAEEAVTDLQRMSDNIDPLELSVLANLETSASQNSQDEENIRQSIPNMSSEELASDHQDLPYRRSQHSITGAYSLADVPASQQCTQPSICSGQCGSLASQPCMNPTPNLWGSPRRKDHSYDMPLLECNESPTVSTPTATYITQNSEGHTTTGVIHRRRPSGLQRQSSLPNPPRPSTHVTQNLRLRQSPHLQRSPNYNNTNTDIITTAAHSNGSIASSSLAPDNDLEYQRQRQQMQQWQCQRSPAQMNSSDSTHSTLSQASTTIPESNGTCNQTHHAWPPSHTTGTVALHQPLATSPFINTVGCQHGQNFHKQGSGESTANSVSSLTVESKPESGHQTGSMLVTGASN